jgi:cytochrome bd-type quinol oxidase subunit 2
MNDDTKSAELLPDELLWADGGHASDIVLTAIADGQHEIVPEAVRAHVERCTPCMTHLGNAALLSLHAGAQLAIRAEHDRVLARRPLPVVAIALGLAVALLGLVPSIVGDATTLRLFLMHDMPLFLKGLGILARRLDAPGGAGLAITYAAAAMLVVTGIAAIRIFPKIAQKETSR